MAMESRDRGRKLRLAALSRHGREGKALISLSTIRPRTDLMRRRRNRHLAYYIVAKTAARRGFSTSATLIPTHAYAVIRFRPRSPHLRSCFSSRHAHFLATKFLLLPWIRPVVIHDLTNKRSSRIHLFIGKREGSVVRV